MGTAPDCSRLPEEGLATFAEAVDPSCDWGHRQPPLSGVYCRQFKRLRCPGLRPPSLSPVRRRGRCFLCLSSAAARRLRPAICPHLPRFRSRSVLNIAGLCLRAARERESRHLQAACGPRIGAYRGGQARHLRLQKADPTRNDDMRSRLAPLATARARGRRPARSVEFEQLTTSAGSLRPSHRRVPR